MKYLSDLSSEEIRQVLCNFIADHSHEDCQKLLDACIENNLPYLGLVEKLILLKDK